MKANWKNTHNPSSTQKENPPSPKYSITERKFQQNEIMTIIL
jgi:hypothetical protein